MQEVVTLKKILIFGNSASGKSTLAKQLAHTHNLAHLDLDTIAWQATQPPNRMPIVESKKHMMEFAQQNSNWVIEGCYADLLEVIAPQANEMIFLNLPIETCLTNAKNRLWEPHKYPSKQAQDENLNMLLEWIVNYDRRNDTFSKTAHKTLFESFHRKRTMYTSNQ